MKGFVIKIIINSSNTEAATASKHHKPAKQLQENLDGQRWIWALQKQTCCIRVFNTTHRCIMPSQNIFLIVAENKPETLTHNLKQRKIMSPKS